MDIINHIILGAGIWSIFDYNIYQAVIWSIVLDSSVLTGGLFLGWKYQRTGFMPHPSDRISWYQQFPWIEHVYSRTHSLLLLPLWLVIARLLGQSIVMVTLCISFHIIFDIATHRTPWWIKPLYPLYKWSFEWVSNIWSLSLWQWLLVNLIVFVIVVIVYLMNVLLLW